MFAWRDRSSSTAPSSSPSKHPTTAKPTTSMVVGETNSNNKIVISQQHPQQSSSQQPSSTRQQQQQQQYRQQQIQQHQHEHYQRRHLQLQQHPSSTSTTADPESLSTSADIYLRGNSSGNTLVPPTTSIGAVMTSTSSGPSVGVADHVSLGNAGGSIPRHAAEAEAGSAFLVAASSSSEQPPPPPSRPRESTTDETSSEQWSASEFSSDGHYEVIEYDLLQNDRAPGDLLGELDSALSIDDNSPAAEALRANANVHVSSMGKVARAVHMQAVRKLVKRATGTAKNGVVRGKPPRLPPQIVEEEEDHYNTNQFMPPSSSSLDNSLSLSIEDEDADSGIEAPTSTTAEAVAAAAERENHDHSHSSSSGSALGTPPAAADDAKAISTSTHSGGDTGAPPCLETIHEDRRAKTQHRRAEKAAEKAAAIEHKKLMQQQLKQRQQDVSDAVDIPDGVVAGTVEAGKKVLGNVDPHDLLKLLRWRRKKKGVRKEPKSYVKGKVIDGEHELYTLSIAVMIGVRTSIARTNSELNNGPGKRWVQLQDFKTTEKYEFRPKGGGLTPPHQLAHTFKFKDYSPVVFAYLRRMYGVNEFDFLLSVCGNANFIEFISNAKSGQFFFYSNDGRYMIKTMTNAESKFLRRILPHYFRHCAENPNTMMTRFFGMYRVKLYHLRRNVKFVIMNSVYFTDKHLQSFYDLKGSIIGRNAKAGEAVKKDNDLRRGLPQEALALKPQTRHAVRAQLESDSKFFRDMGIMDYSMLVGVHHVPVAMESRAFGFRGMRDSVSIRPRKNSASSAASFSGHGEGASGGLSPPGSPTRPGHDHDLSYRDFTQYRKNAGFADTSIGSIFFDDELDDDDCSYLLGSEKRPSSSVASDGRAQVPTLFVDDDEDVIEEASTDELAECKKQETIEKLYWPFHRLFDIHGHRRIKPAKCPTCGSAPCFCDDDNELLSGYNIPKFVPPLSDRKDGGFEMDTSGVKLPMNLRGSKKGDEILYDGKIFYMGIIDILQEFTSRKMMESQYRNMQSGALAASCVPPKDYASRFIDFFDIFSQRGAREGGGGDSGYNDDEYQEYHNQIFGSVASEGTSSHMAAAVASDMSLAPTHNHIGSELRVPDGNSHVASGGISADSDGVKKIPKGWFF